MILGDHGMELVGEYVDIQKTLLNSGLKEQKDYDYFLDSTIARFWSSDKKVLETIVQIINAEWRDMGFWMTEELARKYQIPYGKTFGREYGDIMWCANAGVLIFPDFFNILFLDTMLSSARKYSIIFVLHAF